MIPKKSRFIGNKSIERVYKSTRPFRAGPFNIRVKQSNIEGYRLAVVVSKKVSKSAVVRNRIRRRVFEYARQNIVSTPESSGQEIIITVFEESTATIGAKELSKQLKNLFEKAGIK